MAYFKFISTSCLTLVWRIVLLVAIATYSLTGFVGPATAHEGAIHSASEPGYPPLAFLNEDGKPDGYSVDLMREALAAVGRSVVFKIGPWNEIKTDLAEGRIEALPLVGRTPEREEVFDFTFPYLTLHGAIFVRDEDLGKIATLDDLRGKEVLVMAGDNAEEFVRREGFAGNVITTKTYEEAFRLLSEGRHDAVIAQKLMGVSLLKKIGVANVQPVTKPLRDFRQDFCFAVREGDRETLALLNEGLSIVIEEGERRRLEEKWFGAPYFAHLNGVIVVGGDSDYPPYEYLDEDGRPAGYSVELTRAIAEAMALEVEIRLGPWGEVRKDLEAGRIDVVEGMFYSPERDRALEFSVPHQIIHHAVFRRPDSPHYESSGDLADHSVAVMRGDIMHDFLKDTPFAVDTHLTDTAEEAMGLLADGKVDFALVARLPGLYWIKEHGWEDLEVAEAHILCPEYCYAAPRGRERLLDVFSSGLKVLKATGEYKEIQDRWLGVLEPHEFPWATLARYAAVALAFFLAFAILAFVWLGVLRAQVARKTRELEQMAEERQRMEAELRQAQKMEAIGHLTGGVAHDFNNILQATIGYTNLLSDLLPPDDKDLRECADEILRGQQRAASLVKQMMAFSRQQVLKPENIDLDETIANSLKMIGRAIGENIDLHFRPAGRSLVIHADPTQIDQALINLCVNARDAMPDGGKLVIETESVELDQAYCDAHAWARPGRYAVISVSDTGHGMDEVTKSHIFEPFYTTKEVGKGTGLGLATVFGIVAQHKGLVHVYSEVGKGQYCSL